MSYVEIYSVKPNGEVVGAFEVRNAMGGALMIWERLREKYDVGSAFNYDPLWKLFTDDRMDLADKIVMGLTFDKVIIKRENLPPTINALRRFISSHSTPTLVGIVDALTKLAKDPECAGVCFNHTSVAESYWEKWDEQADEGRHYDLNADQGHWFLFDELPPEAATF